MRLVTKTELRCHTLKRKSQWHGHIPHPKNTTLQTLVPMELRSKLQVSQNSTLQRLTFPHDSSLFHTNLTRHVSPKTLSKSFPQWQRLSALLRTVADGCGRLRTVADGCERLRTVADGCELRNNGSQTTLYPQTPRVKREPFATHSGKRRNTRCVM